MSLAVLRPLLEIASPKPPDKQADQCVKPGSTALRITVKSYQARFVKQALIQPKPLPEKLIGSDPPFYLLKKIGSGSAGLAPFTPEALSEYLRGFTPGMIHASCEDYRASASTDLEHDRADVQVGRKIVCPLLVLWGKRGVIERCFSPLKDWAEVATDVRGRALDGGHYLAEELPDETCAELETFFD